MESVTVCFNYTFSAQREAKLSSIITRLPSNIRSDHRPRMQRKENTFTFTLITNKNNDIQSNGKCNVTFRAQRETK